MLSMMRGLVALALITAGVVGGLTGLRGVTAEASVRECNWRTVFELPPTTTLYNKATLEDSTIKVEIGTGDSPSDNDWGGAITGIYYRSSPREGWGENMIDNLDPGGLLQVTLREGPPSIAFRWACQQIQNARSCRTGPPDHPYPWNPTQGCGWLSEAYPVWPNPAQKVAGDTSWMTIRTYPADLQEPDHPGEECAQLEQTVRLWDKYIEVSYSISQRPDYTCPTPHHPVMFQETPALFVWPGNGSPDDPNRLSIAKLYDGTEPWQNMNLTAPITDAGYNQVFPSEQWLGLFRPGDLRGLTLAYPVRTLHQPYPHMWAYHSFDCLDIMWSRAFYDIVRDSGETIAWTVYVIPGTVQTGRSVAYDLLPHTTWEFALDGCFEGWHAAGSITGLSVQGGELKARATAPNPGVMSLDMLDLASDSISGMWISMALTAGTKGLVSWLAEGEQWAHAPEFDVTADGALHEYYVELDNIAGWGGKTVRSFRLRPTNSATVADGIRIDYIRLATNPVWEFNAAGNNEGWTPVTAPLLDPAWPGHVTGGTLVLYGGGVVWDQITDPPSQIHPALLGPYPTLITVAGPVGKVVEIRVAFSGGPPGTRTARLHFTRISDPKVFDYHPRLYASYPSSDWPKYKLITRFDLAELDDPPRTIAQSGIPRDGNYHIVTFPLPTSGAPIDQFLLEPTSKAGAVYIDYIRVVDVP
jgi:hypothetical protein